MRIFAENPVPVAYKAVIAGASGLTGRLLLDALLHHPEYDEVAILVRKQLPLKHKKLTQLIIDFDKLGDYAPLITGHAIFCCLGSTRKKTPDLTIYRKIDHDYPLELAQIAVKNGVEQYHLVSALGADAHASNFYAKMKGETEEDIKKAGLKCLHIYEPSLIMGERNERRFLERIFMGIMKVIDPILLGSLKKYRSIPATTIVAAMVKQSLIKLEGVFIYPSDKIKRLA